MLLPIVLLSSAKVEIHLLDVDEPTWRKAWDLKVFGYIICAALTTR
jgi:hypothetical protein